MTRARLRILLVAAGLLCGQMTLAPPAAAADLGLDIKGAVVVAHYVQSGWSHPTFAVAEFALGPHVGGLYIGGIGLRQIDGFGTIYPLITYVGQGVVPKLSFLRGVTVTFAMCNEGVFAGKPAYFFGIGVSTK